MANSKKTPIVGPYRFVSWNTKDARGPRGSLGGEEPNPFNPTRWDSIHGFGEEKLVKWRVSVWNFKLMMEVTDPNVDERYCEWSWRWVIADFGSSLYGRNLVGHWMITEGRGLNMQSLKVAVSQLWCANLQAVSGKFRTLSQWWGEVTVTLANLPGGLQCIAHAAPIPFERCMERLGCEGSIGWLFSRYPSKVAAFLGVILRQ